MSQKIELLFQTLENNENSARPSHAHESAAREILEKLGLPTDDLYLESLSYFIRYGFIPLSEKSISEIGKFIGSAPWVGLEGVVLEPVINSLITKSVIQFSNLQLLDNQLCVCINPNIESDDPWLCELLARLWKKTESQIIRRQQIIINTGWSQSKTMQHTLKQVIVNAPKDGTIKLMAYHGRTWLPSSSGGLGFLLDIARARTDLRFKIMLVDPKASGRTIEGATQEENRGASAYGISSLKKLDLPLSLLNRFEVRTYGKTEDESYMRGIIVETKEKVIKDCYITAWFFGNDRGFYGREIKLDGESSLAYLCRGYFDDVFARGWPQVNPSVQILWIIKRYWYRIITLGLLPCFCFISWAINPGSSLPLEIGIGSVLAGLADFINK